MPIEQRAPDSFTIDNFLLGFSQVIFEPKLADGTFGPAVSMGILASEELQKEVELLEMPDGSAGTETTALELVSKLKPQFELGLFNFRADLAQYIFGAESITAVVADLTADFSNQITIPSGTSASELFSVLPQASINPGSQSLACNQVTEVIAGDGTVNYKLAFKPLILGDVNNGTTLEFTETVTATGDVVTTYTVQAGVPAGAGQAQLTVGTGTLSGTLVLNDAVPAANQINPIYTPSHTLVTNFNSINPDMLLDPLLGRIRFPNLDTFASPDATSAIREGQSVQFVGTFIQKAGFNMKPFSQGGGAFQGRATIKHLTDVGSNFIWNNISATIRIDDNALTFGSDDFVQGTVALIINDAGGTQRFGDLFIASQTEAAA